MDNIISYWVTCWKQKKEEKSFRNGIKTTPRSKTTPLSQRLGIYSGWFPLPLSLFLDSYSISPAMLLSHHSEKVDKCMLSCASVRVWPPPRGSVEQLTTQTMLREPLELRLRVRGMVWWRGMGESGGQNWWGWL